MSTRDQAVARLANDLHRVCAAAGPMRAMEVCGTHTVSLFRTGIKAFLPESFQLVSGPGCPVCVTAQGYIDAATELAARGDLTIATYGDMLKVPGRRGSLEAQRAEGASILVVYSIRDALRHAEEHPERQVVFLAVGFETTAPATAAAVLEAGRRGLKNFSVLLGHKLVMPAVEALLGAGDVPLDGFLLPGHVSVIIGSEAYEPVAKVYGKSAVVTGFEPEQMLRGLLRLAELIARRQAVVENVYQVAVGQVGNRTAQQLLEKVFTPADAEWRALGVIPKSGLGLRPEWAFFDAAQRFGVSFGKDYDPPGCRCGDVIQGKALPGDCPHFARGCTPRRPIGPCMVSSEGTCAAWFKYGRQFRHLPPPAVTA
ncbi:MAG TPA: hydrogenase formation protein HypD [bacterium]|nr:hydrogenase formation protein HypD [bacterium]